MAFIIRHLVGRNAQPHARTRRQMRIQTPYDDDRCDGLDCSTTPQAIFYSYLAYIYIINVYIYVYSIWLTCHRPSLTRETPPSCLRRLTCLLHIYTASLWLVAPRVTPPANTYTTTTPFPLLPAAPAFPPLPSLLFYSSTSDSCSSSSFFSSYPYSFSAGYA
eukprot:GHVU01147960.1.p2 GENE.GHVU01147960.1~~GHVU01147960.1.p2  ORF type:complete len:162 (+),score=11.00 GHVU01147960.1:236-721(+)